MLYYETSAKEGTNVELAFMDLTKKIHERNKEKLNVDKENDIKFQTQQQENKCCKN